MKRWLALLPVFAAPAAATEPQAMLLRPAQVFDGVDPVPPIVARREVFLLEPSGKRQIFVDFCDPPAREPDSDVTARLQAI